MILHSVVPSMLMQQMIGQQDTSLPAFQTVCLSDTQIVSGALQNGRFVIDRIYSTDPADFLHPERLYHSLGKITF